MSAQKYERKGLDIKAAFKKHLNNRALVTKETPTKSHFIYVNRFSARVKDASKRLLRTILRPFAHKVRLFLIDELRRDLKSEYWKTSEKIIGELQYKDSKISSCLQRIADQINTKQKKLTAFNDNQSLVQSSLGYVICAKPDEQNLTLLIESNDITQGTNAFLQRYLAPKDTYIDFGQNSCLTALVAVRAMQGMGKIIIFAKDKPIIDLLQRLALLNGYHTIVEGHIFSSFLIDRPKASSTMTGRKNSLDDTVGTDQRVDLIRIDAEGFELNVIAGAIKLIKSNPDVALIVSFEPANLLNAGVNSVQWLSTFIELGFDFQVINPETGELETRTLKDIEQVESVSLFFARKGSQAWDRLK